MLSVIFRGHDEPGFFAHAVGICQGPSELTVLPGNQRTAEARYACLIVVKDYFRMTASSRASGAWHYTSIEPEVLADVCAGRAVLVFDLSNEGPAYDASIFGPVYDWLENNFIPAGRCIWLSQNRLMGTSAEADVGPRARLIIFSHYDYFIKLMAWRFSQFDDGTTFGIDSASYLRRLHDASCKDKLLLCLNATPRLARVLTIAALHHHLLLSRSLVSFPGMSYVKAGASLSDVLTFLDHHPRLDYLRPWVHAVGRMSALRVDTFAEQGNQLVEKVDCLSYQRTFFSLVTESDFAEKGITRVTEKTVKAFCMGHPSLVIGNPGSIALMRGLGFEDWSHVFDRTADFRPSPVDRFELVFEELSRHVQRIKTDPESWLSAARDIASYNHRYATSGAFLERYAEQFDRALVAHMKMLVAG